MISLKTAIKHAYADIPNGRTNGKIRGIVYRITFNEKVFGVVYSMITYDYKTESFTFGLGVVK